MGSARILRASFRILRKDFRAKGLTSAATLATFRHFSHSRLAGHAVFRLLQERSAGGGRPPVDGHILAPFGSDKNRANMSGLIALRLLEEHSAGCRIQPARCRRSPAGRLILAPFGLDPSLGFTVPVGARSGGSRGCRCRGCWRAGCRPAGFPATLRPCSSLLDRRSFRP